MVTVREGAPVISVMFQVAKAADLTLSATSSLFEMTPHLKLREPEKKINLAFSHLAPVFDMKFTKGSK